MIIGIGLDLVDIARIEASIERFGDRFTGKIFSESERKYCHRKKNPAPHYAARFAAKEACAKALGCGVSGGLLWKDMELSRDESTGQPTMVLSGRARENAAQLAVVNIHVTLTHANKQAAAVVILEGIDGV